MYQKEDDIDANSKKYQLSLMNLHDELYHSERAANKGGRSLWYTCDRTTLTTLATVGIFEL